MKKTLTCLILMTAGLTWASAQDATVEVSPSDQIIYPDDSQILNKTPAKTTAKTAAPLPAVPLASNKPVLAAAPVPARAAVPASAHGWFLRWTLSGDEAGAKAWAAALGRPAQISALADGLWEVLAGPLTAEGLQAALGANAQLVRR